MYAKLVLARSVHHKAIHRTIGLIPESYGLLILSPSLRFEPRPTDVCWVVWYGRSLLACGVHVVSQVPTPAPSRATQLTQQASAALDCFLLKGCMPAEACL